MVQMISMLLLTATIVKLLKKLLKIGAIVVSLIAFYTAMVQATGFIRSYFDSISANQLACLAGSLGLWDALRIIFSAYIALITYRVMRFLESLVL
jgi:hypothetical protein